MPTVPPALARPVVLENSVKFLGEAVLPGASLWINSQIKEGVIATAVGVLGGMAANVLLGPIGYVLVRYGTSLASYAQSLPDTDTHPLDTARAQMQELVKNVKASSEDVIKTTQAMSPPARATTGTGNVTLGPGVTAVLQAHMEHIDKSFRDQSVEMQSIRQELRSLREGEGKGRATERRRRENGELQKP